MFGRGLNGTWTSNCFLANIFVAFQFSTHLFSVLSLLRAVRPSEGDAVDMLLGCWVHWAPWASLCCCKYLIVYACFFEMKQGSVSEKLLPDSSPIWFDMSAVQSNLFVSF